MKVLIVGGSGFIGSTLCRELLDRDHEVTALSRSPSSDDLPKGVNKVMGNIRKYDTIKSAFEGKEAVYNLVALSPSSRAAATRCTTKSTDAAPKTSYARRRNTASIGSSR